MFSKRNGSFNQALIVFALLAPMAIHPTAFAQPNSQGRLRDGQHDFDFNIGMWHTHITRVLDPLSGSTHSMVLDGTVTVQKIWGGRAQLEEIEADGPKGHWEGMTLFLYNPQSHEWSQTFVNSSGIQSSSTIGSFTNGRGELFAQDTFEDKTVLLRGVWSDITPDSHTYEESYSNDGGKTWSAAFIGNLTRETQPTSSALPISPSNPDAKSAGSVRDSQHDFDFDFGTWKTHSSRLLHPLTGSKEWIDTDGIATVRKLWNGRANLAELNVDGPAGPSQSLGLRTYNPATGEWYLNFANAKVGTLGIPGVGTFKNGRIDFYDQESINDRFVWVRFSIWNDVPGKAQSEQAFSDDGGKTWEVNWRTNYTKVDDEAGGAKDPRRQPTPNTIDDAHTNR
jgi:hypothetical protein